MATHPVATPQDDHRPVAELHVRVETIQQLIGAEGGFVARYYND